MPLVAAQGPSSEGPEGPVSGPAGDVSCARCLLCPTSLHVVSKVLGSWEDILCTSGVVSEL